MIVLLLLLVLVAYFATKILFTGAVVLAVLIGGFCYVVIGGAMDAARKQGPLPPPKRPHIPYGE